MKKATRFIMMFVAAATMMFVSCGKDDEKSSDLNLADNTLVYDGVTYHMNAVQSFFHNELTLVDATSQEANISEESMIEFVGLHIRPGMWNRTANVLTETTEDISWNCAFSGALFGEEMFNVYEDFSSCLIGIYGENDGTPVTVTFDGTLKNGKALQMRLVTDSDVH
jgi:hypothetical protein